jgi:hypothetical protein
MSRNLMRTRKKEAERIPPNSFCETSVTLTPNQTTTH